MTRTNKIKALKAANKIVMVKPTEHAWEFNLVLDNGFTILVDVDTLCKVTPTSTKPLTLADYLRANRVEWFTDKRKNYTRIKIAGKWDALMYRSLLRLLTAHPSVIAVRKERNYRDSWVNSGAFKTVIHTTISPSKLFVNF